MNRLLVVSAIIDVNLHRQAPAVNFISNGRFGISDRTRFLTAVATEVYPRTIDEWEDGFRRDRNPEREIATWLHIAEVYETFTCEQPLSLEAKQDYLKVLLACSTTPHEHVLKSVSLSAITEEEAAAAIAAYYRGEDAAEC
jgi:hypothetical protein